MNAHDRVRLAALVADRSAPVLLLAATNEREGFAPDVTRAAHDDRCFAVKLRDGVAVLDLDHAKGTEAADVIVEDLTRAGFRCHATESGGPGRAHVWAWVGTRVEEFADAGRRACLPFGIKPDVRGPGSYVRPPGSRHRDGVRRSRLLTTTPDGFELDLAGPRVPRKVAAWVKDGPTEKGHRSEAVAESYASLIVAGHSRERAVRIVAGHPDALKYREPGRRDRFAQELERIEKKIRSAPRDGLDLGPLKAAALRVEKLKAGPKRTLAALIGIAERAGRLEVHASRKAWANAAGITLPTVAKHRAALVAAGYVTVTEAPNAKNATVYRIEAERIGAGQTFTPQSHPFPPGGVFEGERFVPPDTETVRDAFSARPGRRSTWETLARIGPADVTTLAGVMGAKPETVRKHVQRLRADGLAWCHRGEWVAVSTPEAVVAVAKRRGTLGRCHARRVAAALDRRDRLAALAERRPVPTSRADAARVRAVEAAAERKRRCQDFKLRARTPVEAGLVACQGLGHPPRSDVPDTLAYAQ